MKSNTYSVNGRTVTLRKIFSVIIAVIYHCHKKLIASVFRYNTAQFINCCKLCNIFVIRYLLRKKTAFYNINIRLDKSFNNLPCIIPAKFPLITVPSVTKSTIKNVHSIHFFSPPEYPDYALCD